MLRAVHDQSGCNNVRLTGQTILFAILAPGSAHTGCFSNLNARQGGPEGASTASNPHVLRVRSGCCALSVTSLAATMYA
ncbi:hypothetical protein DOT37_21685 [Pantoea agglomerans]|nr:hypothetical protein DOT37_21685 [Pantoea agglomerans]